MPLQSRSVVCCENRFLADWFFQKQLELDVAEKCNPGLEETLKKAFVKVCDHPTHIKNLHDAKQVKGIGTWLLKKLKDEFFQDESPTAVDAQNTAYNLAIDVQNGPSRSQGKKGRGKKRYLPGKNTAGYALLITLFRAHRDGKEFMKKQELIDAAELTGLSRTPIMPVKPSIWSGPRSGNGFYSGWNGMNTLIRKALVIKCSNPAKYMLTDEGKITAQECIEKSGLADPSGDDQGSGSDVDSGEAPDGGECHEESPSDVEDEPGFGASIRETTRNKQNQGTSRAPPPPSAPSRSNKHDEAVVRNRPCVNMSTVQAATTTMVISDRVTAPQCFRQPSINASQERNSSVIGSTELNNDLAVPPLRIGEKFCDIYDVVCILDRREQFRRGAAGSQLQKFAERLETQYKLEVETRQIPVGDAIWIARHKQTLEEYVLDFVIERKAVDDLWSSIKDHRYKNQKLRLLKSGLKRLIYLVEGDVNMIDSTGSCKTAIFSTEIADGFHVLRTTDTTDTLKQYGNLTFAIKNRYQMEVGKRGDQRNPCKTYTEFLEHCKDLDRDRVTDIFCLQLMQINNITEDIALSIQDRYPTIFSLVQAYRNLEGDVGAQEKLLLGIPIQGSSRSITALLSKNVYKLVWAL
ncbi:hypothetical protein R1flu_007325 [Riccia fluitans]|uniref:Crossover junction endonuclease MUS81 n=1 Tax=Riccia fluitans TaxID=41844 RepID=A0ABD1YYL4_9MARC